MSERDTEGGYWAKMKQPIDPGFLGGPIVTVPAWQTSEGMRRERIATAVLAGLAARYGEDVAEFASEAVDAADALIAELDGGK